MDIKRWEILATVSVAIAILTYYALGEPFNEMVWWGVGIGLWGIVDSITTARWTQIDSLYEGNWINRKILGNSPSLFGMMMTKFAIILVVGAYYLFTTNPYRMVIPVGLSGVGVYVTVNNFYQRWIVEKL